MKTEEELKDLARKVIKNEIFLASDEQSISNAFMMLIALGAKFPEDTVALYEEYSKAGPRALNGYPLFTSCHCLNKEEYQIFVKYWTEFDELLNGPRTAQGGQ